MTAARKLIKARNDAKLFRSSISECEAEIAAAIAAGAKTGRLEATLRSLKGKLRRAKLRIAANEPIAGTVATMLASTMKLEPQARARDAQNRKDRAVRSTGKLASEQARREEVTVDSPYGREQGVDKVPRVFHTIEDRRTGLNSRQKMAADRYRWAFETCPSAIRCALDTSGRGGGSTELRSPTEDQSRAVAWLADATRLLGVTDGLVIRRVCGEGLTIDEVVRLRAGSAPDNQRKIVGDRLRTGLSVLADTWWPERNPVRTSRAPDAKPTLVEEREAWEPDQFKGRVAHAAPGRVYGFEPEGGQPGDNRKQRKRRKPASNLQRAS